MQKAKNKLFERAEINWQFVIDNLKKISEICIWDKPLITKQKVWDEIIEEEKYIFDASNAISANNSLGKHYDLFTDKKTVTITTTSLSKEEEEEFDNLIDNNL
jgi:hypothetical protein